MQTPEREHGAVLSLTNMDIGDQIASCFKIAATWIERLLAVVILGGVLLFGTCSAQAMISMDWQQTETFYELVYRVLQLVIGIELARTLVTHDLKVLLTLLAFVIARKTLKPELSVCEILFSILAFAVLLSANHFWLSNHSSERRF